MFNKSFLTTTLLFLFIGLVLGQPTRAPKLFPKMAALTTTARSESRNSTELKVDALQTPKTAEKLEPQSAKIEEPKRETAEIEAEKIQWISFEEALEKQKTEKRKIFMDVYTEWCGWCKRMDESTFSDPEVIKELNKNYYAVKFDAEQKEDITYKGETFKFVSEGRRGYHELAQKLLNGRMGYPTSVFMNENSDVIQPIPGYLDAEKLDVILHYFGSDSYQNLPWETYEKEYPKKKSKG